MNSTTNLHLKRCQACGQWFDGRFKACGHCGSEYDKQAREDTQRRKKIEDIHIPIWRIYPDDPLWLRIIKRPIQIVQLILYAIVAFLIYLSTSLAH